MHKRKLLIPLVLSLVVAGLVGGLPVVRPSLGGGPAAAATAAMAVDAIPGGGGDATRTVTGTEPFDVDVVITAADMGYAGWQVYMRYDSAVLTWVPVGDKKVAYLYEPTSMMHAVAQDLGVGGTIREVGFGSASTPNPPVNRLASLRFQCIANGDSALHLTNSTDSPASYSTTLDGSANVITTDLVDATITCGEGGTPGATATPGTLPPATTTPVGPMPTPTPLPPGLEAAPLAAGCNPVASTYPDSTPIQTIAGAVGPAGNLVSLWMFEVGTWRAFSPQYPQASDLTEVDMLDVTFVCVAGPGAFVRPII